MTEPTFSGDELRMLRAHLLGPPRDTDTTKGNDAAKEGENPPARFNPDDYFGDFVKRMFDPHYAATEPELPEEPQ